MSTTTAFSVATATLLILWSFSAADESSPACSDFRIAYNQIQRYEEDVAVYAFLRERWQDFDKQQRNANWWAEQLEEHRSGPDGQKFNKMCKQLSISLSYEEREFCKAFRDRDGALLENYKNNRQKFETYVAQNLMLEEDWIGLGEDAEPLAADLEEFLLVHRRYRLRVENQSATEIDEKREWLKSWLDKYPVIHKRCHIPKD